MAVLDFHNHLMPAVDDGAQTIEDATQALIKFKADGVSTVITTPHVDGSLTTQGAWLAARLRELDVAFETLERCAEKVGGINVRRGVELLLDIPDPDLSDRRLRLSGGPFFLMEFPFMTVPPFSTRAVEMLCATSYTPIIAHPERYHRIRNNLDLVLEWKQKGALLQINGGSLLGRYGPEPREAALELLERGWADYLCSDYHARGPTLVADYRELLESKGGVEQAYLLMQANPERLLAGEPPIPVPPFHLKRNMWDRMTAIFRS
jgi:protein-tyrosine phosphatase